MRMSPTIKPLKILYAIQGTGNGHVARAREIIPILQKYGNLDVVLTGDQSEVLLPSEITFRSKGLTFIYNKKGGVSYWKTLLKNNVISIVREVLKFPVNNYDVIINDFEFITAWACKIRGKRCFGMGHQVSFLSKRSPRPNKKNFLGEFILKNYAPCTDQIGFHFDHFDDFIEKPVIRRDIRSLEVSDNGHYTVYLPAFDDETLYKSLSSIPGVKWQVFSKFTKVENARDNVSFFPVDNKTFTMSFSSCSGILTSAGFEAPAEALFLGKKVFVIPIKGQYEQFCNAEALKAIGVPMSYHLDNEGVSSIKNWVKSDMPITIEYPDVTEEIIVNRIIKKVTSDNFMVSSS